MTTTIAPSVGEAPFALQAGTGASPGYSAVSVRRALSAALQEGVIDSGSYKVTTNSSGLQLSTAASTGDGAHVKGDDITAQGLYHVGPHSAAIVETATAADATNPRIDQKILEIVDDTHGGGGANLARVRIVAGTPTAGATLENRSGATTLPTSAIRLADILVPAGFAGPFVNATHIRDRRPRALGASALEITTEEARSNTAYGLLATPDVIRDLVVGANEQIEVGYQAEWKESAANVAFAALFVGSNQLKRAVSGANAAPLVQEATGLNASNLYAPLASYTGGLIALGHSTAYTGDVTTGQVLGVSASGGDDSAGPMGPCRIIGLPAGVYDVSVQFKATSGTVTAKNRKLWAGVIRFP